MKIDPLEYTITFRLCDENNPDLSISDSSRERIKEDVLEFCDSLIERFGTRIEKFREHEYDLIYRDMNINIGTLGFPKKEDN